MKRLTFLSLLLILTLVIAACGAAEPTPTAVPTAEPPPTEEPMAEETSNTIVDIAVNDGRFNTLVAAVTAAGLAETLSGEGPFTVFAPTDDAFAALPEGTVDALLQDPQGALTDVLLYHVVSGKVMAADVVGLDAAATLGGEDIAVSVDGDRVMLNGSTAVVITDIEASNGVIHVIDSVLLPPSMAAAEADPMAMPSIAEIAVADGNFTTLVAALDAAGLVDTLSGEGSFTVFAPTDEAFAALPEGTVEALLQDPEGALRNILLYHVVDGKVMAADVVGLDAATSLAGEDIAISVDGDQVMLNGTANVVATDIEASNGVIHVIDAVILPPSMTAVSEAEALPTIAEIATNAGTFNTLLAALQAAGLTETFANPGSYTVFAPTDEAFSALPEGTVEALLQDPQGALTNILLYHVSDGALAAADVTEMDAIATLNGASIPVSVDNGSVVLNGNVMLTATDIMASNGIVHVIDAVLIPAN